MNNRKVEQRYLHLCNFEKQAFSCVPISERWTQHQIVQELYRRYQKKPTLSSLQKALEDLVDAGLIRRDAAGHFHRQGISLDNIQPVNGEKEMRLVTTVNDTPKEPMKPNPIEEIYAIAGELEGLNERMSRAILALDEYLETQKADNDKARKIAALLKEINQ